MVSVSTVLVDANILTLWIVGQVSEAEIPRCRRTRHYSVDDYRILVTYLGQFPNVMITPNVATEVSNLIGVLSGKYLSRARELLSVGLQTWNELYVKSAEASTDRHYSRLGLADAAILVAATRDTAVVTDDFDLYRCLAEKDVPVTNFTHLRAQRW